MSFEAICQLVRATTRCAERPDSARPSLSALCSRCRVLAAACSENRREAGRGIGKTTREGGTRSHVTAQLHRRRASGARAQKEVRESVAEPNRAAYRPTEGGGRILPGAGTSGDGSISTNIQV